MTLKKADIATHVRETVRLKKKHRSLQIFLFPEMDCILLSRARSYRLVEGLFHIIKQALSKGEDVHIAGFGRFQTRFRWARPGRNPSTGEKIILPSHRTVTFRTSARLRKKLNGTRPR
jgi:integration host factor subunit alpha